MYIKAYLLSICFTISISNLQAFDFINEINRLELNIAYGRNSINHTLFLKSLTPEERSAQLIAIGWPEEIYNDAIRMLPRAIRRLAREERELINIKTHVYPLEHGA